MMECKKCGGSYQYRCSKCHYKSDSRYRVQYHTERMHHAPQKNITCLKCGKTLKNASSFMSHEYNTCNGRTFRCFSCPFESKYRVRMDLHLRQTRHSGALEKPLVLKITGDTKKKSFSTSGKL